MQPNMGPFLSLDQKSVILVAECGAVYGFLEMTVMKVFLFLYFPPIYLLLPSFTVLMTPPP